MKTSAFLLRVAICLGLSLIPLQEFEKSVFSARLRVRGSWLTDSPVKIVHLESTDSAGWDPASVRTLLDRLIAMEPAAVLITWFIPEAEVAGLPVASLGPHVKNQRVLWSAHMGPDGNFYSPPFRVQRDGGYGFSTLMREADGMVRRFRYVENGYPSLTWMTWKQLHPDRKQPTNLDRPRWINFAGPGGTIPSCTATALIAAGEKSDCGSVRGKVILVSAHRDPFLVGNELLTPLGAMNRTEILANEILTGVFDHTIFHVPWYVEVLIILTMIIGAAFYIIYYPVVLSAIAVTLTGVVTLFFLFQALFQTLEIYIPSMNIALSLLVSYLVFTGYRLAVQENLQWRSLKKAQFLRELDEMKTNFLSLVSHDIKTPVAKIQTVVRKLKKEETDPGRLAQLESIDNSANELKNNISSILNLSRIEAQKVILNKKSNDINRIIQESWKRLQPVAETREIRMEMNLEPLFAVECDEELIRQVISNLIDNAIKYSPKGSTILVRSREEKGCVRVDVVDSGPGIPRDQLPLMFRKFSRVHRPIKGQPKGTGLGLYLSRYFINLHGGDIRLKTKEGKGTIFTFTLPIETPVIVETPPRDIADIGLPER